MWISLDSASANSYPPIPRPVLMMECLRGHMRWTYSGSAAMVWQPDLVELQERRELAAQAKKVKGAT
jgi:hypothetical protein